MSFVIANLIDTTLSAASASGSTSMTLASSSGLPSLSSGQIMPLVLNDAATGLIYEIVYVTAITGAVLTVERAQEGTTAQNWNIGDYAYCSPTAGTLAVESINANIQSASFTTAADAGAANAYVGVFGPVITAYSPCMMVTLQNLIASNTGASTLNAGGGVLPIKLKGGFALVGGELLAGSDATFILNDAMTAWYLVYATAGSNDGGVPSGTIVQMGTNIGAGFMQVLNYAAAAVSTTGTYAGIFGMWGYAFGGSGSTFVLPYVPAGYSLVQYLGLTAIGAITHGKVKDHTHSFSAVYNGTGVALGGTTIGTGSYTTTNPNSPEGGADNLAAAIGVKLAIKL